MFKVAMLTPISNNFLGNEFPNTGQCFKQVGVGGIQIDPVEEKICGGGDRPLTFKEIPFAVSRYFEIKCPPKKQENDGVFDCGRGGLAYPFQSFYNSSSLRK